MEVSASLAAGTMLFGLGESYCFNLLHMYSTVPASHPDIQCPGMLYLHVCGRATHADIVNAS